MTQFTGPSLEHYLIVLSFLIVLFIGFYFFKKNKHLITNKLQNKKRMKVSDITLLGQGDRALILNLDDKDFLFISGKNSGALLTEIKKTNDDQPEGNSNQLQNSQIKNMIEKRMQNDKII